MENQNHKSNSSNIASKFAAPYFEKVRLTPEDFAEFNPCIDIVATYGDFALHPSQIIQSIDVLFEHKIWALTRKIVLNDNVYENLRAEFVIWFADFMKIKSSQKLIYTLRELPILDPRAQKTIMKCISGIPDGLDELDEFDFYATSLILTLLYKNPLEALNEALITYVNMKKIVYDNQNLLRFKMIKRLMEDFESYVTKEENLI
jgi:hypothetical protein